MAGFPTRSTREHAEHYEAMRAPNGHGGRATWTVEEEDHLVNAVNIDRRSVFRRIRDEVSNDRGLAALRRVVLTCADASSRLQSEDGPGVHAAVQLRFARTRTSLTLLRLHCFGDYDACDRPNAAIPRVGMPLVCNPTADGPSLMCEGLIRAYIKQWMTTRC